MTTLQRIEDPTPTPPPIIISYEHLGKRLLRQRERQGCYDSTRQLLRDAFSAHPTPAAPQLTHLTAFAQATATQPKDAQ